MPNPTRPRTPDDGFLRALYAATARAVATAEPLGSAHTGAQAALRARVTDTTARIGDELVRNVCRQAQLHARQGDAARAPTVLTRFTVDVSRTGWSVRG